LLRLVDSRAMEGFPLPDWIGKIHGPPILPEIVTLALPCGGLSGVSQFLAESTLRTEVRYYYDIDASLRGALEETFCKQISRVGSA